MTPTQLKEAAQVMVAASEGKQVQYRTTHGKVWEDTCQPCWNWNIGDYRIKPEPREWYLDLLSGRFYAEAPCHGNVIKVREVI